jgi:type I restriction-modification system DNA methylase subunit
MVMKKLFEIADSFRGKHNIDILTLIKEASSNNISLDYKNIREMSLWFRQGGEIFVPEIVTDFITKVLEDYTVKNVIDPFAGIGNLLSSVLLNLKYNSAFGLVQNEKQLEVASILDHSSKTNWLDKNINEFFQENSIQFDTVISCLPLLLIGKEEFKLKIGDQIIKLKDSLTNIIMLKSLTNLSPTGIGVFIVPQSFFLESNSKFRNLMSDIGFNIQMAISLPSGLFNNTNVPTNIILVNREKSKVLFAAELKEQDDIGMILENWRNKKKGKVHTLGTFIESNKYTSFQAITKEYEVKRQIEKLNLPGYPLEEVAFEINRGHKDLEDGFVEKENAVFLPLIGKSEAICKIADFKMKNPLNYIQIVLDPKKAIAEFVAHLFNTEYGLALRESLASGVTIPKITKSNLENSILYLPDIDSQHESVKLHSNITDLRTELNKLEHKLWKQPMAYKQIQKELEK